MKYLEAIGSLQYTLELWVLPFSPCQFLCLHLIQYVQGSLSSYCKPHITILRIVLLKPFRHSLIGKMASYFEK